MVDLSGHAALSWVEHLLPQGAGRSD